MTLQIAKQRVVQSSSEMNYNGYTKFKKPLSYIAFCSVDTL